ncbi:hypothetical protein CKO25_16595 [Thiocapsa imhoffii]|uniref:Uncharacterized protein n=1 Tax=Thiocapsa imhoffii TaxID=382777 RepID=A0A9X1BAT5_9GAMM|nr:hypothetical protein [Thiocapsa imhoffii]
MMMILLGLIAHEFIRSRAQIQMCAWTGANPPVPRHPGSGACPRRITVQVTQGWRQTDIGSRHSSQCHDVVQIAPTQPAPAPAAALGFSLQVRS